ncbi:MAG: arginase, partial [Planctomycetota bacterium]
MPRTRTGKTVASHPRKKAARKRGAAPGKGRDVTIVGLPLDLGAGRRGTDMGPSAMRIAGLHDQLQRMGHRWEDLGDLEVPAVETLENADPDAKFLPEISRACRQLHHRVVGALGRDRFPVVLGGDHSAAVGSISGVAHHFRKRKESVGLLWVDAHGDMNTPDSSPSGNVHGMPLAAMLGMGRRELTHIGGFAPKVRPESTVLLGARDVDLRERKVIKDSGIRVFTMTEIDEKGMPQVMAEALPLLT